MLIMEKIYKYLMKYIFSNKKIYRHFIKLIKKNWKDKNENSLYHYAALYQDLDLYEIAKINNENINLDNIYGELPIQIFIKSSFKAIKETNVIDKEDKEKIIKTKIEFNKQLLVRMIEDGANINAFYNDDTKSGEWGFGVATYSRDNIMGSCIEILIKMYWDNIRVEDYEENYNTYLDLYNTLSFYNANINKIKESTYLVTEENISDAMQTHNSVIVSHFFIKYMITEKNLYPIRGILQDKNLDFKIQDDTKNTVLHHLFGRISTKYHTLTHDRIRELFEIIINNKNFDCDALLVKNSFGLKPENLFKKESSELKLMLNNMILHKNLNKELLNKNFVKTKKTKI